MKVMIVDDEVIIRTGLSTVIDWQEQGFTLLEPAASAEEAWARIPLEKPDIIITDIQMTGMNGLELASKVYEHYSGTEIIILTGYDDFHYAQQAVREGVSDYLLKISGPEEIMKAVMYAKQRKLKKLETTQQDQILKIAYRNRMFERLVMEGIENEQMLAALKQVFPSLFPAAGTQSLQVLILVSSGWERRAGNDGLLHFATDNMLKELIQCETLIRQDHILAIVRHEADYADTYKLESTLAVIRNKLKCSVFTAVGSLVKSALEIKSSFTEAGVAFSYRTLIGKNTTIFYDEIKSRRGGRNVCSQEEESALTSILKSGNPNDLRHWCHRIVKEQAQDGQATPDSLYAFTNSIVVAAHRWLERVLASPVNAPIRLEILFSNMTVGHAEPEEVLFGSLNHLLDVYTLSNSKTKGSYVRHAIAFIKEHLDKNITLQQVAKSVHVNPNHLSEVFKRETGLNYLEFVTRQRMERAEEILNESNAKISEVANRVGYEDIKYFSRLFKKHTGRTPSEYRNKD
ncbi:response regulator transcription factor [Cohnella abietis]|uniref:DNA-binding response regulator n=1 Tax=Cohnella abietis TaxID=2507935 RepID=A0A3T1D5Q7_9BACL|nr:response regulator [Cohnella abietis]BBI33431.1 hypothetical protein KCTCHS21_28300 [Cohnella abietis]